jgi:molybdopterin-guanine dinucleotide biosynthesis protein A
MPRTVGELMSNFKSHFHNKDGDVVVHFEYGFHMMSAKEHQELEEAVKKALMNIGASLSPPDPITKFAIMVLAYTY